MYEDYGWRASQMIDSHLALAQSAESVHHSIGRPLPNVELKGRFVKDANIRGEKSFT